MTIIKPVSDLRNYATVLDEVKEGKPVYLTRNGHGAYSVRDIKDEEEIERTKAALHLLIELERGRRSGEEEGWLSLEDVMKQFGVSEDEL